MPTSICPNFLHLLHTLGFLDFERGVLFEPCCFIVGFLLQEFLIILVLGEIELLVDSLAVFKVFQFNLVLEQTESAEQLRRQKLLAQRVAEWKKQYEYREAKQRYDLEMELLADAFDKGLNCL